MKRTSKALLMAFVCSFALSFTACGSTDKETPNSANGSSVGGAAESGERSLWENALYKEDAEIGEGRHSVSVEVKIGEKSVTLTVKSDKDNLADMLTENKLVEGDNGEYGLYIKKVNGVSADYDADGAYWGLNKDGEPTPVGASDITVKDGEHYELVYTKADAFGTAA